MTIMSQCFLILECLLDNGKNQFLFLFWWLFFINNAQLFTLLNFFHVIFGFLIKIALLDLFKLIILSCETYVKLMVKTEFSYGGVLWKIKPIKSQTSHPLFNTPICLPVVRQQRWRCF